MKQKILLFLLLGYAALHAQDKEAKNIVPKLIQKIETSDRGEKLKWLDSLSVYTVLETTFDSDSITKETVHLALELDSMNIAIRNISYIIYRYNNITGESENGIQLFQKYKEQATLSGNNNVLARFYLEAADSYYFIEKFTTAIEYYNQAESYAKKAGNKKFVGLAKSYKGGTQSFLGLFSEASQSLQEAAAIFQEAKDTFNIISTKNSLSILYSQNAFFKEAEAERAEAITLAKLKDSYSQLVSFYYNAAMDARKEGRQVVRMENLHLALDATEKSNQMELLARRMYSSLAIAYSEQDSIRKAEYYLEKLKGEIKDSNQKQDRSLLVDAQKHILFAKGEFKEAIKLAEEHLDIKEEGDRYEGIERAEQFLARVYEKVGMQKEALHHFKRYVQIKDSINSVLNVRGLSYYQTLYETGKRDLQIKSQQADIEILASQNKVKSSLLIFGAVILLSIFSIVYLMRSKKFAKESQKLQEVFSQELIKSQEDERTRLARELHDSVGQKLMLLAKRTKSLDNPEMEHLADDTLDELRGISRGLYPSTIEKLGITGAIQSMVNEVDRNTDIFFTTEIDNIDECISREDALHFYRILQELLTNMVKHSKAKSASISIIQDKNSIKTLVNDNGNGFDISDRLLKETSLGMKTLMERAKIIRSTLEIKSESTKGTQVAIVIPVHL